MLARIILIVDSDASDPGLVGRHHPRRSMAPLIWVSLTLAGDIDGPLA
jgi:hypothetical protein